ncbi:hypothetical protein CHCC20335_4541 [Bacillus paralicheniformis]|nr:hypothetical protein CHCC20335_4541 [Bacillus paralicheniformis]
MTDSQPFCVDFFEENGKTGKTGVIAPFYVSKKMMYGALFCSSAHDQ